MKDLKRFDLINDPCNREWIRESAPDGTYCESEAAISEIQRLEEKEKMLDFLLQYFSIDDIGDEFYVPGVCIRWEELEENLTCEPPDEKGNRKIRVKQDDNMLDVIRKAMEEK